MAATYKRPVMAARDFVKGDVLRRIAQGHLWESEYDRIKDVRQTVHSVSAGFLSISGRYGGRYSQEYAHEVFALDNTWVDVFGVRHDK